MGSSFNSSGVISTSEISESLINVLDSNFYCEPDNSVWIRISHQNNPTTNKFASTDTFTSSVKKSEDVWFNVALCNLVSTWELMIIQAATSDGAAVKYRWIQIVNPMTATFADVAAANITKITTTGYTTPATKFGGIYYANRNSYILCNDGNSNDWWGNIGGWTAYQGGIPGYDETVVSTGYIDLYLRIDNLPSLTKASIYNGGLSANTIIEI